jgi:lipopolysaccharide assembly LptE-like protein
MLVSVARTARRFEGGVTAVPLAATLLVACGYAPPRPVAPAGVHTVAVESFEVQVPAPGAGGWVADAVRREILQRPDLRLLSLRRADAVVRGEVIGWGGDATALTAGDRGPRAVMADEELTVRARLVDRAGAVLVDLGAVHTRAPRTVSGAPLGDAARSDRALRDAAAQIGKTIARRLFGL